MKNEICVLSTKKLASHQKQFLLHADFSVIEADFIKIKPLVFQLKTQPSLLLFTSQNGVKSVLANEAVHQLKSIPAVCVGLKTRKLLEDNGFQVLATKEYAEELAPIIQKDFADKYISFFAGNIRSAILPAAMHEKNISFDEYTVYANQENPVEIKAKTNALLFFSPSGIRSFLKKNSISNEICFCIGTTTADALKGITENIVIANQQTVENVIIQCINYYK
ncbi:MAG TPA: uroporphyrinogen-III synthase [Flavobacterium sp.]|nr:uroporphyrinogen-III synthase [Flavobacterium sp.]